MSAPESRQDRMRPYLLGAIPAAMGVGTVVLSISPGPPPSINIVVLGVGLATTVATLLVLLRSSLRAR
jgi:hypothetical protein